jgi:hypothetical protein
VTSTIPTSSNLVIDKGVHPHWSWLLLVLSSDYCLSFHASLISTSMLDVRKVIVSPIKEHPSNDFQIHANGSMRQPDYRFRCISLKQFHVLGSHDQWFVKQLQTHWVRLPPSPRHLSKQGGDSNSIVYMYWTQNNIMFMTIRCRQPCLRYHCNQINHHRENAYVPATSPSHASNQLFQIPIIHLFPGFSI